MDRESAVTDVAGDRPGAGAGDRPIDDYAVLSDCHSAALVSGNGSIDWLCMPRFDDPSLFGRILDPDAGHWSICPSGEFETRRRYLPDSLVLETQFETPAGMGMVTDALVFDDDERGHDIGTRAPHVLVRMIEITEGEMGIDIEFTPRPEFGLVRPRIHPVDGGVVARGGACRLLLAGPAPGVIQGPVATWRLHLHEGDKVSFALQYEVDSAMPVEPWSEKQIGKRLADTIAGWQSWSAQHQGYDGPWQEQVRHSGRVLQALTYRPTGAIVAAVTTSLPEEVGGERNFDYRYTWIRDASMTMQALWVAACPDEAGRFVSFITDAAGSSAARQPGLQIMYGVGGEHDLSERELSHLQGWRQSRPVRVGNGAWNQRQADVYGSLLEAVYRFREQLATFDAGTAEFLAGLADAAAVAWREPDQGIWETRSEPRHYLHSKVMCWVALDRAVRMGEAIADVSRANEWATARDELRDVILEQGWNERVGAFTQSFGSDDLDAATLVLAMTGFLPASDPRMRSTIDRIADGLAAPCGLLYRYRNDDGLQGGESTFILCSYWLAECWALAGEIDAARDVFERTTAYANDVGLLSEEAEPQTGELLGNFPQAFSHIGLVNAAWAIAQAQAGAGEPAPAS